MHGEFFLFLSQPGKNFVLDDEADAPQNDQSHDGQVHNEVPLIADEIIGKGGIPAIVESRNGIVKGMEEGLPDGKIPGEPHPQQQGSQGF